MNKKLLITIVIALCIVVALTIVSCNQWDTPYKQLNKDGNTVSVKYNINGGVFLETPDVTLVDVFNLDKATTVSGGKKSIVPVDPADEDVRGSAQTASRSNYKLEGWYVTTVNADGSYTITNQKWNFGDAFSFETSKVKGSENPVLVLSARWIPFTKFNIYAQNDDGSFPTEPTAIVDAEFLNYPTWNEDTGKLRYNQYPVIDNKTFDKAYYSPAMSEEITDNIQGNSYFDETLNDFVTESVNVYATYKQGTWYKIYNASAFLSNASSTAIYDIQADLDFANAIWPADFSSNTFNGKIYGNNHTFKNISASQYADNTKLSYGLFGTIGASAVIEKVTFNNVSFTIGGVDNSNGSPSYYGIFAGKIESGAQLTNVALSKGTLLLNSGKGYMFDKLDAISVSQKYQNLVDGNYCINLTTYENNSGCTITTSELSVAFTEPDEKVFVNGIYDKYPSDSNAVQKSVSELFTIATDSNGNVTVTPVA
ncbi:MAG: hypothetical protein IJ033_02085 [Clostridia bacterium]|nr:hypothetical protein [Clostridia bacterium]